MQKNTLLTVTVLAVILGGHINVPAEEKVDRYVFAGSGLSIPKEIGSLKLIRQDEYNPGGRAGVRLGFQDAGRPLDVSLHVYQSPPAAEGPALMLDSNGRRILDQRYRGVYKLTSPSESYQAEYASIIETFSSLGYMLETEYRNIAVAARNDSPVAYSAYLTTTENIDGEDVRFVCEAVLYAIPGWFIKIYWTYPEMLRQEVAIMEDEFIQAINWNEILPEKDSDSPEFVLADVIARLQAGEFSGAREMLLPLHEAGNADASRILGCLYLNGDGVEENLETGREYLKAAVDAGNVTAMFQLGISYRHREPEQYFRYMKMAADEGDRVATQQVGLAYFYGDEGVPQNDILAYKWLFCMQLRDYVGAESWMEPLEELSRRMSEEDMEKARVMAWNYVYIEKRNGFFQDEFDRYNPGVTEPFTVDEYKIVDGQLIVNRKNAAEDGGNENE
jgi:hypothetical protein